MLTFIPHSLHPPAAETYSSCRTVNPKASHQCAQENCLLCALGHLLWWKRKKKRRLKRKKKPTNQYSQQFTPPCSWLEDFPFTQNHSLIQCGLARPEESTGNSWIQIIWEVLQSTSASGMSQKTRCLPHDCLVSCMEALPFVPHVSHRTGCC